MKELRVISFYQHVSEQLFQNSTSIKGCIVQIYFEENKILDFIGSGVYIRIRDRFFLITATHIVERSNRLLLHDQNQNLYPVPTLNFSGYKGWADVAIAELNKELPGYSAIAYPQIGDYQKMIHDMPLFAFGYPATKTRIFSSEIRSQLISCFTYEESLEEYANMNATRNESIVVFFERENMQNISQKRITAPKVNGMSGGGLFWIHKDGRIKASPPVLVGILTRWNDTNEKSMVATQIGRIDQYFVDVFKTSIYER